MSETIKIFLKNQGLNEKEVRIYLDIFTHSQSFASTVAVRTKIDRTTVYSALKRLVKKGVIVQAEINGILAYIPVSPEIFAQNIENEIDELNARKKTAMTFAQEMRRIKKTAFEKPGIKIYEGDIAVKNLYERTLIKGDLQKVFTTIKELPPTMKDFLQKKFITLKLENNVSSKVIIPQSKYANKYKNLDKNSNRETLIISKTPFEMHSEIILFNKKEVAIIDFHKHIYGISIQSDTLFKTMNTLFEYIWSNSKIKL